ncbi:MAG: PIN domain-containing protein [Planctomycetota bacterium]
MRILLDSNLLLRSVEPMHVHHQDSTNAVDLLRKSGHDLTIVPQVLYEFWSVATRPIENNGLGMSTSDAQAELTAMKRLFRLLLDERGVYAEWERLVASYDVKGKKSHDARLVAAMLRHGITHILTFNASDFSRYTSVSAATPTNVASGAVRI